MIFVCCLFFAHIILSLYRRTRQVFKMQIKIVNLCTEDAWRVLPCHTNGSRSTFNESPSWTFTMANNNESHSLNFFFECICSVPCRWIRTNGTTISNFNFQVFIWLGSRIYFLYSRVYLLSTRQSSHREIKNGAYFECFTTNGYWLPSGRLWMADWRRLLLPNRRW